MLASVSYARSYEHLLTGAKCHKMLFHGGNTGSNPVGDANVTRVFQVNELTEYAAFRLTVDHSSSFASHHAKHQPLWVELWVGTSVAEKRIVRRLRRLRECTSGIKPFRNTSARIMACPNLCSEYDQHPHEGLSVGRQPTPCNSHAGRWARKLRYQLK
jgi:hypothetical protein